MMNERKMPPALKPMGRMAEMEQEAPATPEPKPTSGASQITPEMVCYRDAEETCGNCSHMGQDSTCAVLGMAVDSSAGCNAFTGREGSEESESGEMEEEEKG